MPYVENLDEFTDRQNCEYVDLESTRFFKNGARAKVTGWYQQPFRFWEPPKSRINLIRAKLVYWETSVAKKIRNYNRANEDLLQRAANAEKYANITPPHPQDIETLKDWATEIQEIQETIKELKAKLPETKTNKVEADLNRDRKETITAQLQTLRQMPRFKELIDEKEKDGVELR